VEDDPVAAHFAVHVLTRRGGFDVTHTPDPAVALRHVRSQSWDLVITDTIMPGMTGFELLDAVRQISPELPVVVMSAYGSMDAATRILRSRADAFLQKPVRPELLLATATSLIAEGHPAGGPAG
jgi:CheY-like chemotaxis protein